MFLTNSRFLNTFVPNKSFGQLIDISSKNLFLKTFNSEFPCIELWLTDQFLNHKKWEIKLI